MTARAAGVHRTRQSGGSPRARRCLDAGQPNEPQVKDPAHGHYFDPHPPYLIPDRYYDMYDPSDVVLPDSMAETFTGKPPVQRNYSDYWTFDSFDMDERRKLIAIHWAYVTMLDEQIGRLLNVLDQADISMPTATVFAADHSEFTGAHRLADKGPAMYDDIYRMPPLISAPEINPSTVIDGAEDRKA